MVERPITISFFEDNRFKPVDNTKIKNFRGAVKRLTTEKRPCVEVRKIRKGITVSAFLPFPGRVKSDAYKYAFSGEGYGIRALSLRA